MQARGGQAGHVADVVQPRRCFQQIGVRAENRCQAASPRGDALDMRPAAGTRLCRSARASCCAHNASVFMRPRLGSRDGTFRGRGRPSGDVLPSVTSRHLAMRSDRAGFAGIRDAGGFRRCHRHPRDDYGQSRLIGGSPAEIRFALAASGMQRACCTLQHASVHVMTRSSADERTHTSPEQNSRQLGRRPGPFPFTVLARRHVSRC